MKLKNPFSEETRLLFLYCYECGKCGQNGSEKGGLELHHIYGRISSSPYNAIVLCGNCHGGVCHNLEEHVTFSEYAIRYLAHIGYERDFEDSDFLHDVVLPDIRKHNEINSAR